ncbi:MAG TPA: hypothetical protein VF610_01290 [Segetibacter sp.]|jgi:hypothetical protein
MSTRKTITIIGSLLFLFSGGGCIKDELDVNAMFCLPSKQAFYSAWGITAPSRPCPYEESDRRNARLTFSDGTTLDILPGFYGNGGVFLQDLNCRQNETDGFLTNMIIRWTEQKHGSSVYSFSVYGCNARTEKMIKLKDALGRFNYLYTNSRQFSYNSGNAWVHKEIEMIQLI